ncbi:hypothetical protein A0H81_14040 [Grifola frondosa]|uniref:Uncharacterized protein n=1 Tax=Grifola frondosa TaxID=5627 RepID=A0A1C7LN21_GRIFR|nr:hypothetical protein A0H81_14040 [Grifola frondosa]
MGLARRWRPRRPPDDCAGVALRSGAKTVLQILNSLAGGTSVPFLQAATQSTLHIIQLAADVKQNRDDCIALAQLAGEIMQAVLSTTSGVEEHLFDPQIKEDILELQTTLDSIYDTMLRLSKLSKLKRIVMRDKYAAKLGDYKSRLQNAVLIFNIKNGLSQRILIIAHTTSSQ